jgi:hypothetical protein
VSGFAGQTSATVIIVMMIASIGLFRIADIEGWSAPVDQPHCMEPADRDRILKISLDGIDQALKEHVVRLFDVWVKDRTDQPRRARAGMFDGVNAYLRARSDALKWAPPPCKEQ